MKYFIFVFFNGYVFSCCHFHQLPNSLYSSYTMSVQRDMTAFKNLAYYTQCFALMAKFSVENIDDERMLTFLCPSWCFLCCRGTCQHFECKLLALLVREKKVLTLRHSRSCPTAFSELKVEISEDVSLGAWCCFLSFIE